MRSILFALLTTGALATFAATPGCTANVHDNTVTANVDLDHANISVSADTDVNNVQPASVVPFTVTVDSGVYLIEPSQTPPPDKVSVSAHFQVYLDDENSAPILVTASTKISVTIPASTPPGPHKVICRLHHHDGTPTQSQTQVSITVTASVTTGTPDAGAGGGTDAG